MDLKKINEQLKPKEYVTTMKGVIGLSLGYDLHLFVNADGFDQAMAKFDLCGFEDRPNWKIFLECENQPA